MYTRDKLGGKGKTRDKTGVRETKQGENSGVKGGGRRWQPAKKARREIAVRKR